MRSRVWGSRSREVTGAVKQVWLRLLSTTIRSVTHAQESGCGHECQAVGSLFLKYLRILYSTTRTPPPLTKFIADQAHNESPSRGMGRAIRGVWEERELRGAEVLRRPVGLGSLLEGLGSSSHHPVHCRTRACGGEPSILCRTRDSRSRENRAGRQVFRRERASPESGQAESSRSRILWK